MAATYQHIAELLHFVLIERFDFFRSVVGFVLRGDHLQAKTHRADVDIRRVVVPVVLRAQVRSRINRNAVIGRRLFVGVDLQVGEGCLDIDLLVLLVLVADVDAARGQQQYGKTRNYKCRQNLPHFGPPLETGAGAPKPAPRLAMPGMVTGRRPGIGISPNIAFTALSSETCALEKVHKYVWTSGNWAAMYGLPMAATIVLPAAIRNTSCSNPADAS